MLRLHPSAGWTGETPPKPVLNFTPEYREDTDKLSLAVSHDAARYIFSHSNRDNCGLEMPPEYWCIVIPALVVRMPEEWKQECLKAIHERLGVTPCSASV